MEILLPTTTSGQNCKSLTRFHPASIMANPEVLKDNAETYFLLANTPPTPAGLALHLGFASARVMTNTVENDDYPEESRYVLAQALTMLEDSLVTSALMDNINVPMAKFVLSARLGMAEKSERHTTSDTVTDIRIHGLADDSNTNGAPELAELL